MNSPANWELPLSKTMRTMLNNSLNRKADGHVKEKHREEVTNSSCRFTDSMFR